MHVRHRDSGQDGRGNGSENQRGVQDMSFDFSHFIAGRFL